MKVAMGSVAKGFALKEAIKVHLEGQGHEVVDVGCYDTEKFYKFPAVGQRIAHALQSGEAELAINCCGSGTGASIAAGKFGGICAVSCESVQTAKMIRVVNDANCLCLGELVVSPELGCEMADTFLGARFQDADGIPPDVLDFWAEARDELTARGPEADGRDVEIMER
ncbi:MAG: RpiB/LacA/LacB family sugar-phosphate isomerase [Lentisphaerae bacterium]|jgi:ribose 5-phosphate isomerase B|nr:RpiB/LacA/LacB family sugar-phosphate isomerase [Lentisphaerota bacterium]MBT4818502.1 RpiB/LacA/LacB family sugar-phosphate isomerase [Lentisphaerota bacterium]MBT5611846.1 RpiB/LacA/LacB family sugar-phosphate isomerase [Lentisphaerota bacterium]MBT7059303.1 RpiB/LacA/LacB family sugar-phosphate isomerase [Lentisphaerota bacterium]MBT7843826.1 RpiB/LacA/LacB family sugar-phosphate isomerase [Lentisphaerota bacterium]